MSELAAIQKPSEKAGACSGKLAEVASHIDDRTKNHLFDRCCVLALRFADVGRIVEPLIVKTENAVLQRAYREKFSQMRCAAAIFHAN